MYKMTENQLAVPDEFFLPVGGKWKENRWVGQGTHPPWAQCEEASANQLNEAIVREELAGQSREDDDDQDDDSDDNDDPPSENTSSESADTQSDDQPANQGKLLLDATCTPADIAYPTDLGLLNEAREK